jgi:ParB family transcriptional regulator, chromosome partitioning protein
MSKQREEAQAGMLAGAIAGAGQAKTDRQLAEETHRGRAVTLLSLESIRSREQDTRPAKADQVLALAESICAVGLLQPPAIDKAHRIIAGLNRITACRLLLTHPSARRTFLSGFQGFDDEMAGRIDALPAIVELPEPLAGGKIPVRVMLDLDAHQDPEAALAAEAAENIARRQYAPAEVKSLAKRLYAAGFREVKGRPKKGEKALRPALANILGLDERHVRRLLNKEDKPQPAPKDLLPQIRKIRRMAVELGEQIGNLPAKAKAPRLRDALQLVAVFAADLQKIEDKALKEEAKNL